MFRGFGHFRKRGLRPLILTILRRSPKNGMEIMDEIVKDGLVKKGEDALYELTSKAKNEDEWPFGSHFAGPRSVEDMLNEISGYVSYFEDMSKTDKSKLESYAQKIRALTDRLSALVK